MKRIAAVEKCVENKDTFRDPEKKGSRKKICFCVLCGFFLLCVFCVIFTLYSYFSVENCVKYIHEKNTLSRVPFYEYCMVLGTSRYVKSGVENLYFRYRMEAVLLLYKNGKCGKIIVSGDNGRKEYDEPSDMKNYLMEKGVKEGDILCDYAGFRTLDSVLRMRNVFQLKKFLIVSQKMHCLRAVYIGRKHNLDVAGFTAEDVPLSYHYMGYVREVLARNKAVLDIITGKKPYFEY